MTDYTELESRLRDYRRTVQDCESDAFDAADAIKELQAEVERLNRGWLNVGYVESLVEDVKRLTAVNKGYETQANEDCALIVKLTAERDAALAASRHETDLCQQAIEEIENLQKQITEMREIGKLAFRAIVSSSDVIHTIVPENDDEEARVFELQNQLHDVGMSLFTVCRLPDEDAQLVMERKRA